MSTLHVSDKPFTVAVLADIHGNLVALESVLADLATESYDQLVIAGDLVMNGPHPAETLACIRALGVPTLFGETDRAVAEARRNGSDNALAVWTAQQIETAGITYLETLDFSHRITPPQNPLPEACLHIVHATPTDPAAFMILEPNPLDTRCDTRTSETEALLMLGETNAGMVVHGHLHYASLGFLRNQQIVSIGSVGFPFDGNPQAAYAIISWDGGNWNIQHRRVTYDYESVVAAVAKSGQPMAETMIRRLRTGRWCP